MKTIIIAEIRFGNYKINSCLINPDSKTLWEIVSCARGDRFVVLKIINLRDTDEILKKKLYRIGKRIKNIISQEMKFKVTVGIGEYYQDIRGLSKSFKDATQALDVISRLEGVGDIYHINNLGIGNT